MIGFIVDTWGWIAQQTWWLRGVVGALFGALLLIVLPAVFSSKASVGSGGRGGNASVGGDGTAIGGKAGGSGPGGSGGAGGDASVAGKGFALGGEGGEAGQPTRGGSGGRSPIDVLEEMGLASDTTKQIRLFQSLQQEYFKLHPEQADAIASGKQQLPDEWTNQKLREKGFNLKYTATENGYRLSPLQK
jgi:hypothetical protein